MLISRFIKDSNKQQNITQESSKPEINTIEDGRNELAAFS
jgi:hypothetical protein